MLSAGKAGPSFPAGGASRLIKSSLWVATRRHTQVFHKVYTQPAATRPQNPIFKRAFCSNTLNRKHDQPTTYCVLNILTHNMFCYIVKLLTHL